MYQIIQGDCRAGMATLARKSVQTCVTSPPYFGLRDYGHDGQLGLEQTPEAYIAAMVEVFRGVRDVLADDGTLWVNIGDSYMPENRGENAKPRAAAKSFAGSIQANQPGADLPVKRDAIRALQASGIKRKDLIGIPWMLAFALRADGWYLRQDIIWTKPNPMPESVTDRCTKSHEYLFLLSKEPRYYFDHEAIKEPAVGANLHDATGRTKQRGMADTFKRTNSKRADVIPGQSVGTHRPDRADSEYDMFTRNKRDVWTIATRPYKGAHFATFPPALAEPCILAGSRPGDLVLDPFGGSGTTGAVAVQHGRHAVLCELNPEYIHLAHDRIGTALTDACQGFA